MRFKERLRFLLEPEHDAADGDNYRMANRLRVTTLPQPETSEDLDACLPRNFDPAMMSIVRDI